MQNARGRTICNIHIAKYIPQRFAKYPMLSDAFRKLQRVSDMQNDERNTSGAQARRPDLADLESAFRSLKLAHGKSVADPCVELKEKYI